MEYIIYALIVIAVYLAYNIYTRRKAGMAWKRLKVQTILLALLVILIWVGYVYLGFIK